jgi:hypothetical protein
VVLKSLKTVLIIAANGNKHSLAKAINIIETSKDRGIAIDSETVKLASTVAASGNKKSLANAMDVYDKHQEKLIRNKAYAKFWHNLVAYRKNNYRFRDIERKMVKDKIDISKAAKALLVEITKDPVDFARATKCFLGCNDEPSSLIDNNGDLTDIGVERIINLKEEWLLIPRASNTAPCPEPISD